MQFMVGYQVMETSEWVNTIIALKKNVSEVYFPWPGFASGRGMTAGQAQLLPWEVQERTIADLDRLHRENIDLTLLLNGNCYGGESLSRAFFERIQDTVEYLRKRYQIIAVTTASPVIGRFLRQNCPEIEVRASVNMSIGSPIGMALVQDDFDAFYLQRECNRNFDEIQRVRKWCDVNGKRLYLLANSGCFAHCSAHTFHDNLVAHEEEIVSRDNMLTFEGVCWRALKNPENRHVILSNTTFIRPEDISMYKNWFDGIKLATRSNANPSRILKSYVAGTYHGALTTLMEPDFTAAFYPNVLDNARIDNAFANQVLHCNKHCDECGYCKKVYENALLTLNDIYFSK